MARRAAEVLESAAMTEPLFVPTEITLLAGLAIGLLVGWVARSLWEHPDE